MGKKCVKTLVGIDKTPRNIYLVDIKKAYSHIRRKTPKLPKYEDDDDVTSINPESRNPDFE